LVVAAAAEESMAMMVSAEVFETVIWFQKGRGRDGI
jgi:hypothetical protein